MNRITHCRRCRHPLLFIPNKGNDSSQPTNLTCTTTLGHFAPDIAIRIFDGCFQRLFDNDVNELLASNWTGGKLPLLSLNEAMLALPPEDP